MQNTLRNLLTLCISIFGILQVIAQAESHYGLSILNNPQSLKNRPDPYWGVFFWEFPDGTYKIYDHDILKKNKAISSSTEFKERASHSYCKKNDGKAFVYITPFNSADLPKKLSATAESQKTTAIRLPDQTFSNDLKHGITVEHSLGKKGQVVYGSEFRVAVKYKDTTGKGGKLIILYDKTNFSKGNKPVFQFENPSRYQRELGDAEKERNNPQKIPELTRLFLGQYPYGYGDNQFKAFEINGKNLNPNAQCFFFSLKSLNLGVDIKTKKEPLLYFTIVWIPNGGGGLSKKEVILKLSSSYDPNNIIAPRSAYQQCFCSEKQKLNYTINFENKGKDPAYKVIIKMLIGKGLDKGSFVVKSTTPPYGIPPQRTDNCRGCLIQKEVRDTVILTFNDIGLKGRSGWFRKKGSRGSANFSISRPERWTAESVVKGIIFFDNNKGKETNTAKTVWRKRGLYLKTGYSFGLNQSAPPEYVPDSIDAGEHILKPLTGSISYENAPIGKGILWGWEAGFTQYRFTGNKTYLEDTDFWYNGLYDIRYLDAKFTSGYQFSRFFRLTGGIGVAAPIKINQTFSPFNDWEGRIGPTGIYQIQYGFLQKKGYVFPQTSPFGSPKYYRPRLGLNFQWGAEFGVLHLFAVGLEQQIRYIPKFYPTSEFQADDFKASELFSNFNVYAKATIPICWLKCKINSLF